MPASRATRFAGALLLVGTAAGVFAACKSSGVSLSVDLRTDYVPGREFTHVVTEAVPDGDTGRRSEHAVPGATRPYVDGTRVADFGDLPPGDVLVRVKVVGKEGPLVERLTRVRVTSDYALTVVVTRNCEGVVCPQPGGDPKKSTCDRGVCVEPDCTVVNPLACAPPECSKDADCKPDAACVSARCIVGTCLFVPDDSKCSTTQTCDPTQGCVPPTGPVCTPTGSSETKCDDGVDDDCDGLIDCLDPDCDGKTCEDGDKCTEGEKCSGSSCSGGTPKTCDDGNPCTDDACDPKVGCTKTNNTSPCDDGVYCNGADTCAGGACAVHAGDPCAKGCDEAGKTCLSCAIDGDCGPVTYGAWSACGGFAGTCDEGGTQSRSVTTPKCEGGRCTTTTTTETRPCTRNTDGTSCGTTTYGSWSSCGGFANACDQTGSRSRSKTTHTCAAGACKSTTTTETDACTRTVANGTSCGSGKYCCSGSGCVSKSSPNHCSSCGIKCSSGNCVSVGGGNYSCTCSSNAQCQSDGFGPGATCWSAGGPMVCNCQCTGKCCAGGATCFKPSGINYCDY